ncbi:hypothetical protein CFP56_012969 [Quercus suber]|uniref:Uncharacterized protein n=1 Tax=Quercus suber TaxID=58331 RepID=A0AAW0KYK7_QUESU
MLPGFSTSKPQKPIKKSNPKQIKPKFRVAFSSTDPIRFFRVAFSSFAGLRLGSSFARWHWGSSGFGQNRRLGSSFAHRRWGSSGFGQNRRLGSSFACRCWGSSGFGQNRRRGSSFARRGWGSSGFGQNRRLDSSFARRDKTVVWYARVDNLVPRGSKVELNADRGLVPIL